MVRKHKKVIIISKRRRKGPKKRKKTLYSKPATMRYGVQCMGVGKTIANIDGTLSYQPSNSLTKTNILAQALSTEEYLKYSLDFRYVKILAITVSVMPLVNSSNIRRYFKFDWISPEDSYGILDIVRDDNAKVVYGNITKNTVLKFKPPNTNVAGSFGISYNLHNWILTVDTINTPLNYEGVLSVFNADSTTVINWNVKMVFRGAVITQITTKIQKLIKNLDLNNLNNLKKKIEEEQERKEKEVIKDIKEDIKKEQEEDKENFEEDVRDDLEEDEKEEIEDKDEKKIGGNKEEYIDNMENIEREVNEEHKRMMEEYNKNNIENVKEFKGNEKKNTKKNLLGYKEDIKEDLKGNMKENALQDFKDGDKNKLKKNKNKVIK